MPRHPVQYRKRLVYVERRRQSAMGNPRFLLRFEDGHTAQTEVDGSIGYEVENLARLGGLFDVKAHAGTGSVWDMTPVVEVGDHVERRDNRALDSRPVARVEGDQIWLDIFGQEHGPLPVGLYRLVQRATEQRVEVRS